MIQRLCSTTVTFLIELVWAVGGKKYTSMTTSEGGKYYGICTNSNSISIEMCSNKLNTKKLGATDTDWYLTEATIKQCCRAY